jgi:hypothetical protein
MAAWDDPTVIANSKTFNAGETAEALVDDYHTPAVCVSLESLEGSADDTITVEIDGTATTYEADKRTLNSTGSYIVEVPQADAVSVTSANGTTITAEARNNPR